MVEFPAPCTLSIVLHELPSVECWISKWELFISAAVVHFITVWLSIHFGSKEMSSTGNGVTLLTSAQERKKFSLDTVTADRVLEVV